MDNLYKLNAEKNVIQNWDKNGNIYYTDENGERISPFNNVDPLEHLKRKLQATKDNTIAFLENENTESDDYKRKVNAVLALETAPMGIGTNMTLWGASKLTPFLGKKIAKTTIDGIGGGLVGGAVEGFGRGLIEGENPWASMVSDATLGALMGGFGGFGLGKLSKKLDSYKIFNNIPEQEKYFYNYVDGLNNNTSIEQQSLFSKELNNFRGLKENIHNGNTSNEFSFTGKNKDLNYRDEWVRIGHKDYRVLNLPKKDYRKILHVLDTNLKIDDNIGDVLTRYDDNYAYTFKKISPMEYKFIKRVKLK